MRGRVLHWWWRSDGPVVGSDLRRRDTDDASARLTVGFDFEPPGLSRWDRVRHRVARARLGDLAADFRRAFGHELPPVTGIGLLTDADDTGGRAAACYGDLLLLPDG